MPSTTSFFSVFATLLFVWQAAAAPAKITSPNTAKGATKYFYRTPEGSGDVILTLNNIDDNRAMTPTQLHSLMETRTFWGVPFDHKQYFNESLYIPGQKPDQSAPGNVWSQDPAPRFRRDYAPDGADQKFYLRNGFYRNQCVGQRPVDHALLADQECGDHTNGLDWYQQPYGDSKYVIGFVEKDNGVIKSASCLGNTGTQLQLVQLDLGRYRSRLEKDGLFPATVCNIYTGVDLDFF